MTALFAGVLRNFFAVAHFAAHEWAMKFFHFPHRVVPVILALVFAMLVHAGLPRAVAASENTALVVNADSWASMYIANEYIRARQIPQWNVVYLSDLPSFESLPVEDFRQKILLPVLQTLESRGLPLQIDAVLYSADFPTMIDVSGDAGKQQIPPMLTPFASINGLTYLYQFVISKSVGCLDLGSNFYFRRAKAPVEDTAWTEEERKTYIGAVAGVQEAGRKAAAERQRSGSGAPPDDEWRKKLEETFRTLNQLKERHPAAPELLYNVGCSLALLGRPEEAVASLQRAADTGWWEVRNAERDNDLVGLRGRPDFEKFLSRTRALKFDPQPAMAFRGAIGWHVSGAPMPPDKGRRYLISTMLAYTSGRGNSVREAISSLRQSVAADGTRPKGTIYFMKNADVRSATREWGFEPAVAALTKLGVKAVIEQGALPQKRSDVAGTTVGAEGFAWITSGSRVLPGAICEHLTSCGGMLREGDGQTPLSEFIRYGAAAASGTVAEPFAIQAKFPTPFIHTYYAQGCSVGEAFYQSIAGPYQLLIVGDALASLWKRKMTVSADGLRAGMTLEGTVKINPKATSGDGIEPTLFELYVDGRRAFLVKKGAQFEWNTLSVPDGPHEVTILATGSDSVATQGRLIVPVVVRNGEQALAVTWPEGKEFVWDKSFAVKASLPGATEIVIMQNVRPVARIKGDSGTVELDLRRLGQGPVRLIPMALREGEGTRQVVGKPFDLKIVPPAALRSVVLPAGRSLIDDLALTIAGQSAGTAKRAEGEWLAKAGVKKDTSFSIEGWFSAPEDDVYQFQLRGNVEIETLAVDEVPQSWPRGREWWFVPVHLAKGLHRLRIVGRGVDQPALEVRFGGPGAVRLDGARFKHLMP
ncbi:MAG TPA: hypothetical protein VFD27_12785 [Chthoniobacteraceae bacterium]|nr:hypothetical protein [Chthoniobacteraceae bacterium]